MSSKHSNAPRRGGVAPAQQAFNKNGHARGPLAETHLSGVSTPATPPWKQIAGFAVLLLMMPLVLLGGAGRADWWQAWAYIAVTWLAMVGGRLLIARRSPDLLRERASSAANQGTKGWDRALVPLIALWGPALIQLIAALDLRFGWPPALGVGWNLLGLAMAAVGAAFATWAMVVNRFFSAHVRIQKERGHRVIESGPYRVVRHPGYAGSLLLHLGTPLLLGSLWAYLPVLAVAALTFARTALEDRALQAELTGYRAYTARTRFRLIPGLW